MAITEATRGERNNNPGNIERNATKWVGMAEDQSRDFRFVIFTDPKYGIRAIAKIMKSYGHLYDCDTISEIINKWAPSVENDTKAYIDAVVRSIPGILTSNTKINVDDLRVLVPLVKAIIHHENGRVIYSDDVIFEGVKLA
jgi:hypothetical protein